MTRRRDPSELRRVRGPTARRIEALCTRPLNHPHYEAVTPVLFGDRGGIYLFEGEPLPGRKPEMFEWHDDTPASRRRALRLMLALVEESAPSSLASAAAEIRSLRGYARRLRALGVKPAPRKKGTP